MRTAEPGRIPTRRHRRTPLGVVRPGGMPASGVLLCWGLLAPAVLLLGGILAPAVTLGSEGPWAQATVATPHHPSSPPPGVDDSLPAELRGRLEAGAAGVPIAAGGEAIHATRTLPLLYVDRAFEPIWLSGARLRPEAVELREQLRAAAGDGLDPTHYHLAALDSLVELIEPSGAAPSAGERPDRAGVRERADLELLLTDAFLLLGSHLLHGRLDPVSMEPAWTAQRPADEGAAKLRAAIADALGREGVAAALDSLRPAGPRYALLREALAEHRRIAAAGGWEPIGPGPTLDPGDRSARIEALRARLQAAGSFAAGSAPGGDPQFYDEDLRRAVTGFQRTHGLEVDGRVGPATLAALNVPVTARIDQLVVNLERWRWLPRELGDRHILVNIPAFSVSVVDQGAESLRLRAVVGRRYRQTPVFSARMTYLAFAPYWNVPPGIAANDQLPRLRDDPSHLARERITLLDNATNRAVDPHSVDWSPMSGAEFNRRFRLRQEPGPHNALGEVKFMFPNRHNVYLHDTPGRELFDRTDRDFSSGCIRVERPLELAAHLLRDDPAWTAERMRQVIRGGREQAVVLPHPYDVHIQYWTAWIDEDETLQLRRDLYDRDGRVRAALRAPPPRPL